MHGHVLHNYWTNSRTTAPTGNCSLAKPVLVPQSAQDRGLVAWELVTSNPQLCRISSSWSAAAVKVNSVAIFITGEACQHEYSPQLIAPVVPPLVSCDDHGAL